MSARGTFITFEGGDGAGKTTQIALLAEALRQASVDVLVTREPGGCTEAETLRNLILHRHDLNWSPMSLVLLLTAARAEHVRQVIDPALAAGKTVICDRFFDSTLAYQGYGAQLDPDAIRAIHAAALDNIQPDITFILDIDVRTGLERVRVRGMADTIEKMDIFFHERLRQGFLAIAEQEPERVAVIDAGGSVEDMHMAIREKLSEKLGIAL